MRTLLSVEQIAARVKELGVQITRDFQDRPLTIIGVLHGSVVFVADLSRAISAPHQLGFVLASSYRGPTTSPGALRLSLEGVPEIAGRCVLLVDDILDTGRTLAALTQQLSMAGPGELRTAVLLWKRSRTNAGVAPDYCGFEIPDRFVVGYGLDYNGDHRHLPYIAVLEE